ncbi:hypothetical protein SETIT_9G217000v2, partial [Setaria italica]
YNCVLCVKHVEETISHLFFTCPFSEACWLYLGIHWDPSLQLQDMIVQALQHFGSTIFREIVTVVAWSIWCHRNSIIFDGQHVSFAQWRRSFVEDLSLVSLRAKPFVSSSLNLWLSSLI